MHTYSLVISFLVCIYMYIHVFTCIHILLSEGATAAILTIIEGLLQVFKRFSSSKLVLTAVEGCFVALNYYENGSSRRFNIMKIGVSENLIQILIY
jgi:hypothetical protein